METDAYMVLCKYLRPLNIMWQQQHFEEDFDRPIKIMKEMLKNTYRELNAQLQDKLQQLWQGLGSTLEETQKKQIEIHVFHMASDDLNIICSRLESIPVHARNLWMGTILLGLCCIGPRNFEILGLFIWMYMVPWMTTLNKRMIWLMLFFCQQGQIWEFKKSGTNYGWLVSWQTTLHLHCWDMLNCILISIC